MVNAATDLVLFVQDTNLDIDTDPEINIMRPDGTDHRIIRTKYPVQGASINAKGDWIAYTTRGRKEIRAIHISGTREKVLTRLTHTSGKKSPELIKWSPNGRYILYTRRFSGGRIGYQLYDAVKRRHNKGMAFSLGKERKGPATIVPKRIMWSPNSKTFAVFSHYVNSYRDGLGKLQTSTNLLVHDVRNANTIRTVRNLFGSVNNGDNAFDFASNNEIYYYYQTRIISVVQAYNFRRDSWQRAFQVPVLAGPGLNGLATNPDRNFVLLDGVWLAGSNFVDPGVWSSISGEYRGSTFSNRNMGVVDVRSLAFTYVTPLTEYSVLNLTTTVPSSLWPPNLEWRRVRSGAVFRTKLCYGWVVTKRGTSGNDRIVGTDGADVIAAGAGNDSVDAKGGMDVICGGSGNDVLKGGTGADVLYGDRDLNNDAELVEGGDDKLIGAGGADTLWGQPGNDNVLGGSGNDFVHGGSGNDVLDGMTGSDTLNGGDGTDQCKNYVTDVNCE